jgi:hypothetical protein
MRKIFKYPLAIDDYQEVLMPLKAEFLCVQIKDGGLMLWALVDAETKGAGYRKILIHGTGNPIDDADEMKYIGTVQQNTLVWHVFEKLN